MSENNPIGLLVLILHSHQGGYSYNQPLKVQHWFIYTTVRAAPIMSGIWVGEFSSFRLREKFETRSIVPATDDDGDGPPSPQPSANHHQSRKRGIQIDGPLIKINYQRARTRADSCLQIKYTRTWIKSDLGLRPASFTLRPKKSIDSLQTRDLHRRRETRRNQRWT